jgi:ribonuclease HII
MPARAPVAALPVRPPRILIRPSADAPLGEYEAGLRRAGFVSVAGADEAGRGACAGPLVVGACVLPPGRRGVIDGLNDSKLLTAPVREQLYAAVVRRAVAWSVVVIPAADIDRFGLHVANLAGMRRAIAALGCRPSYALTDGFPVPGLGMPATAVWKGDATVACVAAASILAKVTRDRIMVELHDRFPEYDFARHKGYVTPEHSAALREHGPCPEHRQRYVNVRAAARSVAMRDNGGESVPAPADGFSDDADWEIA